MAEAAEADDRNFAAFADVPVTQRRPGSDAGAENGRHGFDIEIFRHFQHEGVADGDGFGVAAVGGLAVVFVDAVVGTDEAVFAVLFEVVSAGLAVAAGIDEAANADKVARFVFADARTDAAHTANDFMTRHHGVYRATPVVARGVQVAVADAGVEDVDNDVVSARRAVCKGEGGERAGGRLGGVGFDDFGHGLVLLWMAEMSGAVAKCPKRLSAMRDGMQIAAFS
ncbi:hypothetical protein HMPREF9080_01895 [Cardiobacterium valvarum F0432]|uniref:Uncharacterized protein n=1 Tax=Cardiobacterium valvarum F0432 TaxID=797473 RepID=G9ZGJ1_9GAMM|nr:hypothetical protein HMPREF9080_01895 [Cardiobacterium valvarum F0432]